MQRKYSLVKFVTIIYLYSCLWGLWGEGGSQELLYIITIAFFAFNVIAHIIQGDIKYRFGKRTDKIATILIAVWLYGFVIGIIRGNNRLFIIRNFAGLLLYSIVFILNNSNINLLRLQKGVLFLSFLSAITIPIAFYLINYANYPVAILERIGIGTNTPVNGKVTIWMSNHSLIFISYGFCLFKCIYNHKWISIYSICVLIEAVIVYFCARSGGILLELFAITAAIIYGPIKQKTKKWRYIIYIFVALIGICILYKPVVELFDVVNDESNIIRLAQIKYIFQHLSIFGHGLGAQYSEIGKGYGIEVIYLDLLYKFGIFSFVILGIYVYTVIKAIRLIQRISKNAYNSMAVSFMGYLFVALGNPVLFAGASVVSHVLSLIIIEHHEDELFAVLNNNQSIGDQL